MTNGMTRRSGSRRLGSDCGPMADTGMIGQSPFETVARGGALFKLGPEPKWEATVPYTGLANGWGTNDPTDKWNGWINAIDPKSGTMTWRVKTPSPMYAAITPTAGNVVFTGDLEGNFLVLDARNGKEIYRFNTGGPIAGGVVTWAQKGRQYIAVASGHSGGSIPVTGSTMIVVFAY